MKYFTAFLVIVSFLCLRATAAQETLDDPRLKSLLEKIDRLRDAPKAEREERIHRYLADLENLEKKVQATGDLEKVLQVVGERKAWAVGEPTPIIDPKDEGYLLDLRKLRYYFEQDVAAISAKAKQNVEQARPAIEQRFVEVEKVLTTEGKIQQALEVRRLREQILSTTIFSESEAPANRAMPIVSGNPVTATVSFPLPDPEGYPPLPSEEGRLVLIPYPEASGGFEEPVVEAVERDDFDDLVVLGELLGHREISAIRADGKPVVWDAFGETLKPRNISARRVWSGLGAGLIWVDDKGRAGATQGWGIELSELRDVKYLSPTHGLVFAIDGSGERHVIGNQEFPNAAKAFEERDSIISASFGGLSFIMTLAKDGAVIEHLNNVPSKVVMAPGSTTKLLHYGLAVSAGGKFVSTDRFRQPIAELVEQEGLEAINSRSLEGKIYVIETVGRRWLILEQGGGGFSRIDKLEEALIGALDVHPTYGGILALLPSGSIPRSGLWELDELIAARK